MIDIRAYFRRSNAIAGVVAGALMALDHEKRKIFAVFLADIKINILSRWQHLA